MLHENIFIWLGTLEWGYSLQKHILPPSLIVGLQFAVYCSFLTDSLVCVSFKIDLEGMVRSRVSCLKPEYIASFLTDDPLPDPAQFYIPEVAQFVR